MAEEPQTTPGPDETDPPQPALEAADFGSDAIEMPDIPMPTEEVDTGVHDKFVAPVAFKYAFCGSGQGGSRLAESFYKLGYQRVVAVNTALQDLESLELPPEQKMEIATGGAGKDPKRAEKYIRERREDVYDLMARRFGTEIDRIFITIGGGGGTGSGSVSTLISAAHELLQSLKVETDPVNDPRVGVICTMPMRSESRQLNANAYHVLWKLMWYAGLKEKKSKRDPPPQFRISPLILVDNERIKTIYPQVSVQQFWPMANRSITTLFHVFNLLAEQPTRYTVFDKSDLDNVLASGLVTFGATPVKARPPTQEDISFAIRDNIQKNVLAGGIDLRTGQRAACIVTADSDLLSQVPQQALEHGFEQLSRIMGPGSVVHSGIYTAAKPGMSIYTMIGGLQPPIDRIKEIGLIGDQMTRDWDLPDD